MFLVFLCLCFMKWFFESRFLMFWNFELFVPCNPWALYPDSLALSVISVHVLGF